MGLALLLPAWKPCGGKHAVWTVGGVKTPAWMPCAPCGCSGVSKPRVDALGVSKPRVDALGVSKPPRGCSGGVKTPVWMGSGCWLFALNVMAWGGKNPRVGVFIFWVALNPRVDAPGVLYCIWGALYSIWGALRPPRGCAGGVVLYSGGVVLYLGGVATPAWMRRGCCILFGGRCILFGGRCMLFGEGCLFFGVGSSICRGKLFVLFLVCSHCFCILHLLFYVSP